MRHWKVVMPGMMAVVGMVLTGILNAEDAKGKATLGNMQAAYKAASNAKTRYAAFAVCGVCGFTVMGPSPAMCPVCSSPGEKYKVIE